MKKFTKLLLALGGISAVGAGLAGLQTAVKVSASLSVSTKRLFVINNAWSEQYQMGIYIFNSSISSANSANWGDSKGMVYIDSTYHYGLFYYDVPTDATIVLRQKTDASGDAYQSVNVDLTSSVYSSVWTTECLQVNWVGTSTKASASVVQCTLTTASQLGNLLSYFVTCDSSDVYGYNAYPRLNNTFFAPAGSTLCNSTEKTVKDYDYTDSSIYNMSTHTYVNLSGNRVANNTSVSEKINAMSANYARGSNHVGAALNVAASDTSSTIVLGGIAAAAVLAAGGYFFVRKKKSI